MNNRIGPVIGVVLVAIVSVGVLVASNMGHIATVELVQPGAGSLSGTSTINLPYDLGPNLVNAKNLMDDIGFANVLDVQRFIEATDSLQIYTGRKGSGAVFDLAAGECYRVRMNTTTNYSVVGSHVPTLAITLNAAGAGSLTGTNSVSLPFNITARNAKELMDDIGFASVANVQRFVTATDSLQIYTGRKGSGPVFPIRYDECYRIKMNTTVNSYIPSHY